MAQSRSAVEILEDVALGALAGALGTYLMQPAAQAVPKMTAPRPRGTKAAKAPAEAENATEKMARRMLEPLGIEVSGERKRRLGLAVHWSYGVGWGALYGAAVGRGRGTPLASGILLGFGLWLLGDEIAVPALKLSKSAASYPVETHARALASHLAYGATTDGLFRLLRSGLDRVRR